MTPPDGPPGLERFNALTGQGRARLLTAVCASPGWVRGVLAGAPFADAEALLRQADGVLASLSDTELDAALDGHPRIGARTDDPASAREQSAVGAAGTDVRDRLAAGNLQYEERFGHVYLVCASGRSAEELLDVLTERLHNDAATERRIMRDELAKINRLRLQRLLNEPEDP